eukprot:jgi/Psemu1/230296/e_gw1.3121.5.1
MTQPTSLDEDRWNRHLEQAKIFIQKHGHGRVPVNYPPDPDLANWAKRQRYHYKLLEKHMADANHYSGSKNTKDSSGTTSTRLRALVDIGFCLDNPAGRWEHFYRLLEDYSQKNHGSTTPSKHTHRALFKWVGTQKYEMTLRRKGRNRTYMTQERIRKVNAIGFDWGNRSNTSRSRN